MEPSRPILSLKGVVKAFGGIRALDGCSLEVRPGTIIPGWEVVYGTFDSAKNLAIEGMAGIKYMLTDKVSIFFEYKYSYQFDLEYQDVHINKTGAQSNDQTSHKDYSFIMNFPHHRIVLGIGYHFKNLFGN